jgi:uncharacterized protein GlcG (DUF336 family)
LCFRSGQGDGGEQAGAEETAMTKLSILVLAALAVSGVAAAQAPPPAVAPAPPPPRARGPALGLAVEAAQQAVATCLGNTYKVSALIVDSGGDTVVLLSGDGAAARTQAIAASKIATVMKYKVPSGDIADKVKTDPALDAAVKADPKIGTARRGALPIVAGGEMIGAFAVSGAPGGDKDEACVKAGLDKVAARLK